MRTRPGGVPEGSFQITPLDSLVLCYQVVLSGVILFSKLGEDDKFRLVAEHLCFLAGLLALLWALEPLAHPIFRFFREMYPLILMLFFYKEIGLLIHGYFDWSLDDWLLSKDYQLGHVALSVWHLQQFHPPSRLLNEIFSLGYGFYLVLIPLAALTLYWRAPLNVFRTFLFSLCFTYYLCYLLFIFLPAESPRFYIPGLRESLEGYWISEWVHWAVEGNAFPGGSFPSSHIAAAVICMRSFPYLGRWRYLAVFFTLLLFLGTIYGRYHYSVDVMAGLVVGLVCYVLAPWLQKHWPLVLNWEQEPYGRIQKTAHGS
ncbi:MAG TPA: phosphatase PAP2 family protein [bacterium]|nr:phosphatase PAP2 family protein [bacterium]